MDNIPNILKLNMLLLSNRMIIAISTSVLLLQSWIPVPSRTKSLTSEDKNLQFKNSWTSGRNTSSSVGIKIQVFWGSYYPAANCNLFNTYQTDTTSKMTIDKQVYVQVHEKKDINLQEKWGVFPGALPGGERSRTLNGGFIQLAFL